MKSAFLKIKHILGILWRTLVSMFVKKKPKSGSHFYCVDVDQDHIKEFVIDPNGLQVEEENNLSKGENNYDNK